jgi:hypothetical protein
MYPVSARKSISLEKGLGVVGANLLYHAQFRTSEKGYPIIGNSP